MHKDSFFKKMVFVVFVGLVGYGCFQWVFVPHDGLSKADRDILTAAVQRYSFSNGHALPTIGEPTEEVPRAIDFEALSPSYFTEEGHHARLKGKTILMDSMLRLTVREPGEWVE